MFHLTTYKYIYIYIHYTHLKYQNVFIHTAEPFVLFYLNYYN